MLLYAASVRSRKRVIPKPREAGARFLKRARRGEESALRVLKFKKKSAQSFGPDVDEKSIDRLGSSGADPSGPVGALKRTRTNERPVRDDTSMKCSCFSEHSNSRVRSCWPSPPELN